MIRFESRTSAFAVVAFSALLGACDLDVSNPGPVQDEFLNDPAAHAAAVTGAHRALALALNQVAFTGAVPAREVTAAGSVGAFGHSTLVELGKLTADERNT